LHLHSQKSPAAGAGKTASLPPGRGLHVRHHLGRTDVWRDKKPSRGRQSGKTATPANPGAALISSEPGDAKVYINGQRKGTTPTQPGKVLEVQLEEGNTNWKPKPTMAWKPSLAFISPPM
jgi:hypothetical protein